MTIAPIRKKSNEVDAAPERKVIGFEVLESRSPKIGATPIEIA